MSDESVISVWVLFHNPADFPGMYVVREQRVMTDGSIRVALDPSYVGDSIDKAHDHIPHGCVLLSEPEGGPQSIVEVWI